jgi:hypothetical protein
MLQLPAPRATQCFVFGIPWSGSKKALKKLSAKQKKRFTKIAGDANNIGLLVMDEGSFNDNTILEHISSRFQELRNNDLPFGGLPVLLFLDFHQKESMGTQFHKALLIADLPKDILKALGINGSGKNNTTISELGVDRKSVNLFRRFRRFNLTQQMRASEDPDYMAHLNQIRDIFSEQPINEEILQSLQPLTPEALQADPKLMFTRIVTMSWKEIFPLTLMQLGRWAKAYNLPLIRWRKTLVGESAGFISAVETEALYEHESAGLYEYFVENMPGTFTTNIDTSNGIVNGARNTYVSLTLDDDEMCTVEELIEIASKEKRNWSGGYLLVTLKNRPLSINVKMTVLKEQAADLRRKNMILPDPVGYHPNALDSLREVHLGISLDPNSFPKDVYKPTSTFAAFDMPRAFKVKVLTLLKGRSICIYFLIFKNCTFVFMPNPFYLSILLPLFRCFL